MSFFKELKEDIAQSVNELTDSLEETVNDTAESSEGEEALENAVQKEINSILEDDNLLDDNLLIDMSPEEKQPKSEKEKGSKSDKAAKPKKDDKDKKPDAVAADEPKSDVDKKMTASIAESVAEIMNDGKEDNVNDQEEEKVSEVDVEVVDVDVDANDETTVITKGTTISGGIKSDTSLEVKGVIEGDVECLGKLTITGRVAGNSKASEIYLDTPRLEGNLESKGSIKIDVGTVVIGNIFSASVVVAGAVKGDIEVNGPIIVDSTAVVKGNIIGKTIQINSGAVIDGSCSLKYADVDLDSFFE